MLRLSNEDSRERWRQIHRPWNQWDPIGVVPDQAGPDDEYEGYLSDSRRLLERQASEEQIDRFLIPPGSLQIRPEVIHGSCNAEENRHLRCFPSPRPRS
jgi:hypothetical protein